jgi:hypothetical protein
MKIKLIIFCFLLSFQINATILWQDNFNGFTSGWTPSVGGNGARLYPWTTNQAYDYTDGTKHADGGGSVISDYEPSIYAQDQRTNANSWNGWVQYSGSISIETTGGVDNSPVLRIRQNQVTGLSGELGIHKWLGPTNYQEIYVSYKFKFAQTYQWNGALSSGCAPASPGIIWKLGRVWTGFNPIDYDKTGGQSQPVEDTTWDNESNWRAGIWIWRWMLPDSSWGTCQYGPFMSMADFYAPTSCTPPASPGTCDSQSDARTEDGNVWDWFNVASGNLKTYANSGENINSDGTWDDTQGWHQVKFYIKNRTNAATDDGDFRMWIDGVEITGTAAISPPILASMVSGDYGLNFVRFGDNWNRLTDNISTSQDYYIDDVVIATTYAELDGEIESSVSGMTFSGMVKN